MKRSFMEKISLFGKIRSVFDRKQKIQLLVLGIMIFIGGILETLGVGAMRSEEHTSELQSQR